MPGLNITQTSARDINVTSRAPTGTLATGELALLDGRSLYQDFFGFVMWDFLPVNLNEIKQIEVIRGPASAVWGANAVNGVINVITKSPREMQGTTATIGLGMFERTAGEDAGSLWYISGTHAEAVNDRWAFKLSGGGYVQDPLSRPTGFIPGTPVTPTAPQGTRYPPYNNTGTTQPKFDGRLDYDYEDGRVLSFTGGVSGTEGIMHTGIGPFDINSGSLMSYGRVNFGRKGLRVSAFTQMLDGDADNLLTRDPAGNPIAFAFNTKTTDVDIANVQTFANAARRQLRREPALQQVRPLTRSERRQSHRVGPLRAGRDLSVRSFSPHRGRPGRSFRLPRQLRVLAARRAARSSRCRITPSASRTTGPIGHRRSSTTFSTSRSRNR